MSLHYYLQTFGCQMNVHDSDRMAELLEGHGWSQVETTEEADLIVLNTCSVREKAEHKLRSELGKLAPLKQHNPDLVLAVTGCVAQQEGEKLLSRTPFLDLVLGPDNLQELPKLVMDQRAGSPPMARTVFDNDASQFLAAKPRPGGRAPTSVFVTTMKGCDERCSFCIVPYTRGSERYRASDDIVEEIKTWVDAGAREVTLLGQTVDSFQDAALPPPVTGDPDESQFPHLLRRIAKEVPGLLRLRYTSPHPRHLTQSLIDVHAELPVLAAHVHMPVQSGSDRVLKRMIRRYTRAEYIKRVKTLQAARPGLTLSTDMIVGFPGETEDDFQQTLTLVEEVGFVSLFGFSYSPRPYTPALKLPDDVPREVKSERLARLFAQAELQGKAHLKTLVGKQVRVLVEGPSKSGANRLQGRTERHEIVHLPDHPRFDLVGQELTLTVDEAFNHSLLASLPDSLGSLEQVLPPKKLAPKEPRRLAVL